MIRNASPITKLTGALAATMALVAATPASAQTAQENQFDGKWHYSITPYLWLPNVNGSASVNKSLGTAQGLTAKASPSNYLSDLKFAAMISADARKGVWSIFTDYIYLDFNAVKSRGVTVTGPLGNRVDGIDLGTTASLRGDVWTLAGGYAVVREKNTNMDVVGGFRYLGLDTAINWNLAGNLGLLPANTGTVSQRKDKWDPIVGVKGQLGLGEGGKWFIPYYLDAGAGAGNTTWQAMTGVGYRYGWGEIALTARSLSYKFTDDNSSIRFAGPALMAAFRF